jgi:hypothetical protein
MAQPAALLDLGVLHLQGWVGWKCDRQAISCEKGSETCRVACGSCENEKFVLIVYMKQWCGWLPSSISVYFTCGV